MRSKVTTIVVHNVGVLALAKDLNLGLQSLSVLLIA